MESKNNKLLGVYTFIRNGVYYDYPFLESLRSYYPIADQISIMECYSDKDNTYEILQKFIEEEDPDKKIILNRTNWVTNFKELANIANMAGDKLTTDWIWQIQGDEVLHESQFSFIRVWLQEILDTPSLANTVEAINVNYDHFLGNYDTTFPFIYSKIPRIARRGSGWKLTGDACHLSKNEIILPPPTCIDSIVKLFHYGKVHSGEAGWQKEWDFQNLFTELGFPDPKMKEMEEKFGKQFCDYLYLFEDTIKKGEVYQFFGEHPAVMKERIKKFNDEGHAQFQSKIIEGLRLK